MRQRWAIALLAITTIVLGLATPPAQASPSSSQRENAQVIADVVDRHNAVRRSRGLSALKFSPKIAEHVSQRWSQQMAASGNLSHNPSYGWPGANRRAENVAYTSSGNAAAQLMDMWVSSSGHRANLLDPRHTVIAVGVATRSGVTWATANFYAGPLRNPGTLYNSGAEWLAALSSGTPGQPVDVYTTPGTHHVNGRDWRTTCVPYSRTKRCNTEIWATAVTPRGGKFVSRNGWVFNNLTYLPSPRSLWKGNNLGRNAEWSANGRRWRTECDTATTGRNGCRSYIWSHVVVARNTSAGYRYSMADQWVFNNIVQFS